MFFTNDVLVAGGGKFSIIWLAATRKTRIKRKDCQNVDIIKICNELQKNFKPMGDGRMSSVKGFSLRLSAQLVYGVTVVYNMKVMHLYKDVSFSVQSLHKFQSQLQLYPAKIVAEPIPLASSDPFVQEDPMFGEPLLDINVGPGFSTQPSYLNVLSNNSVFTHHDKVKSLGNYSVKDLSTITLPEDIPSKSAPFADEEQLLAGDQVMGSGIITDIIFEIGDMQSTNIPERPTTQKAVSNVTTPAAALQTTVKTPSRPSKHQPKSPILSKTSEESLATPLSSSKNNNPVIGITDEIPIELQLQEQVSAERGIDLPNISKKMSDNNSDATSELILIPITEKEIFQKRTSHSLSSLIIDKKIELHSDLIRNQLSMPLNTIEDYINEGNIDVTSTSIAIPKKLFEQPTSILFKNAPSCIDPYMNAFGQSHFLNRAPVSAPQILFTEITNKLFSNLEMISPKPTFSAHKLLLENPVELLHPEDDFEVLHNGPSLFDETAISSMSANDTFTTDHSSIPKFRDVSRHSLMPHSLGESDQALENLEQTQLQSETSSTLNQSGFLDFPSILFSKELLDLPPKCAFILKSLQNLGLYNDTEIAFSTLAPPDVTPRHQAAEMFFNVLMLAKNAQVSLHQKEAFQEIFMRSYN